MKKYLTIIGCASLLAASAGANTITFTTPSGATESGGNPVDASVTFITGANSVQITLTDLLANPTTVAQLISDISFRLTSGQTVASISATQPTVDQRTVNAGGSFTDVTATGSGWGVDTAFSGGIHVTALGFIGPAGLIIGPPGPGGYTAANSSIAGNPSHNPFLFGPTTINLTVPGVNVDSSINNVVFSFGTTAGDNVPVTPPPGVPDGGTTVLLLGAALSGLGFIRRRLS